MRKLLFFSFCFAGVVLYRWLCGVAVDGMIENYGMGAAAIATLGFIGACFMLARRVDRADAIAAARLSVDYRQERVQEPDARSAHSRPAAYSEFVLLPAPKAR